MNKNLDMKVLILAGGFGSRISEESGIRPKPMVEIGNKPILWHIMKYYSFFGFNDFVILLGYKGNIIKEYFANYYLNQNSVEINLASNQMRLVNKQVENWKVTLLDTGENALTADRLFKARNIIGNNRFMFTYGDGVSDVDINKLLLSHEEKNKKITMTLVQPESRFGLLTFDENNEVNGFQEKPKKKNEWINGGFFICEPEVFNYIDSTKSEPFEKAPLEKLAFEKEINGFKHTGFWKCMDTLNDKNQLNDIWNLGNPPWKNW